MHRSMSTFALALALSLASPGASRAGDAAPNAPSFEDRVAATRAIERVSWAHRVWPEQNPGPKPSFESVVPDDASRRKVENALRMSAALDAIWHRPITHGQLQAEMDRIGRETKDGATLHEILDALGDDPTLEAEVLVRPILADRLLRSWYAFDPRFHAEVRAQAEAALRKVSGPADLRAVAARYAEVTWTTRADTQPRLPGQPARETVHVDADELAEILEELKGRTGTPLESESAFYRSDVIESAPDTLTIATGSWPKTPFGAWWQAEAPKQSAAPAAGTSAYSPIQIDALSAYCANDTWVPTSQAVPSPRVSPETVWTGSEMIVWSGSMPTPDTTSGARYNPVTDSWTPMTLTGAPQLRYGVDAVWTGTEMIVWGGGGTNTNTGGRYDPSTDTWVATSTIGAPSARQGPTAVWSGTEMIVWGGYDSSVFPAIYLNTGGRYNPSTDTWVATSTIGAPTARGYHRSVWVGSAGVMVAWGGHDATTFYQTGSRYSPSTNSWNAMSVVGAPSAREFFTAVSTGSRMIVWGGDNSSADLNDGGIYDPGSGAWSATATSGAPSGRHGHTAIWTGTEMIVWGGWAFAGPTLFGSGGRYDPNTNLWIIPSSSGAPAARRNHVAVWTGTEMIVWGGDDGAFHDKNTGGRYSPASDSWVPTSTVATAGSPPTARWGFSTIWTGTQMWVWGGFDVSGVELNGGAFDPAMASWANIDSGQWGVSYAYHCAVWTGTQMLVFGGYDGEYWNTLWYFDPSLGGWDFLSFAPIAAREKATAVWTGTGMIVWGGENGGTAFNDGAIYTPSGGTWQVIAATTLAGRYEHTAIWNGASMWVWGGHDLASNVYGNGAMYTPASNTWTGISTKGGVPSARFLHSAVWTGSQMIVWGGTDGTNELSTGGIVPNEILGGWTAMTATDSPVARAQHTAVWDGGEMIVWGGESGAGSRVYGDGKRYTPSPVGGTWPRGSVSSLDAPTARYAHKAVWTGNGRMIVWGGIGQNTQLGGVYCACPSSLLGVEGASGLSWAADKATLGWGSLNGSGRFNVYRGTVNGAWTWAHPCLSSNLAAGSVADSQVPSVGQFFHYLVSGRNDCGESTLGTDSSGTPRPNPSPCP